MLLTLIFFMQAQPPQKVSWLLWASGIFFFLAGLAMLILLIRKRRHLGVEDEPEFKKLFVDETAPAHTAAYETQPLSEKESEISEAEISEPEAEPDLLSSLNKNFPDSAEEMKAQPDEANAELFASADNGQTNPEPQAVFSSPEPVEDKIEERIYRTPPNEERIFRAASDQDRVARVDENRTFSLSNTPAPPASDVGAPQRLFEEEPAPAIDELPDDKEIWHDLPVEATATSTLASSPQSYSEVPDAVSDDSVTRPLVSAVDEVRDEVSVAPIEHEVTELPVEQVSTQPSREPFEPPRIEPLVPQTEHPAATPLTTSRPTKIATPLPSRETRLDREPLPAFASEPPTRTTPAAPATTAPAGVVTSQVTEPAWHGSQAGRKVAGAVLGLPVETSDAPLVIGKPVIPEDEIGVTGFTNYGKAPDASDTGRGGLITLLLVVLVVGGGIAAYFKVPAFHARVDSILTRLRTGSAAPEPVVEKPKAQVIPSRNPEVNKNIVKAKGAVLNISEDTLEEVSIEVSFYRGEKVIETRTVALTPNTLAPNQQATYEFDYDGSKSNGFALYSVTKLMSKNGDVKFTSAKQ
jgi:hypothetical protein